VVVRFEGQQHGRFEGQQQEIIVMAPLLPLLVLFGLSPSLLRPNSRCDGVKHFGWSSLEASASKGDDESSRKETARASKAKPKASKAKASKRAKAPSISSLDLLSTDELLRISEREQFRKYIKDFDPPQKEAKRVAKSCVEMKKNLSDEEKRDKLTALETRAKDFVSDLEAEQSKKPDYSVNRITGVEFDIESSELSHERDVKALQQTVEDLFKWFEDEEERTNYLAPYICVVQSSGMGKTKLLYELRKRIDPQPDWACKLCLCLNGVRAEFEGNDPYDGVFKARELAGKGLVDVRKVLDSLVPVDVQNVVLMFDEAQILLPNDAFLFRCIRSWLTEKRPATKIVAVFCGTNSQLSNFFEDRESSTSRDAKIVTYYDNVGRNLYPPFFHLTTVGCLTRGRYAKEHPKWKGGQLKLNDMLPYGRPLFALIRKEENADEGDLEEKVLSKMLLGKRHNDWEEDAEACLSILGTRLQLGTTRFNIASNLVSAGYAYLMSFRNLLPREGIVADVCYVPDPLCARLAMCMMDEDWKSDKSEEPLFRGKSTQFWAEKLADIASTGVYEPPKGDMGEVAAAFYTLSCGDRLRKQQDPSYNTISVPLSSWASHLKNPGQNPEEVLSKSKNSTLSISFMQVCRNYLRAYESFPASLWDQGFLERLYVSGVACYTFPGCEVMDLVGSIRQQKEDGSGQYLPLLISVKCRQVYSPGEAAAECNRLKEILGNNTSGLGALGIVMVFGQDRPSNYSHIELKDENITAVRDGNVTSGVVVIPRGSPYDITVSLYDVTSPEAEINEILPSHAFITSNADVETKNYLRRTPRASISRNKDLPLKFLDELRKHY
jgi:hypothetical protein